MLTNELVRARQKDGELHVNPLGADQRARALELAEHYVTTTKAYLGRSREELDLALDGVPYSPRDRLVAMGLRKLIDDRCEFTMPEGVDPEALRRELFLLAAAARRDLPPPPPSGTESQQLLAPPRRPMPFDRAALLAQVAAEQGLSVEAIERGLYADLRSAQLLKEVAPLSPQELVLGYDLSQAQAVLLRAVRIVAEVQCHSAAAYRALFRKLKFLRLLCRIDPIVEDEPAGRGRAARRAATPVGYRVEIDGPLSLFDQVTKYGLQLALALPALLACDSLSLTADVRWGKERTPLRYQLRGGRGALAAPPRRGAKGDADGAPDPDAPVPAPVADDLPEEVEALVRAFQALGSPYDVQRTPAILNLPGVGLCVPDLVFRHRERGLSIYFEVLGYWSRDAVWRRVELVEAGLPQPVLFALSARLRVSEKALPADLPAALYVYKGVLNAKVVLERLDQIAQNAKNAADAP